jgi:HrpA-like RNA helicase
MDLHCSQGKGDILMFLTGQDEIDKACTRLNDRVREMPEDECPDMQVTRPSHAPNIRDWLNVADVVGGADVSG